MKKITIFYIAALIAGIFLVSGSYAIISFGVKTYITLQEEDEWIEISVVAKNTSYEDVSRRLLAEWLETFMKRQYVSAIDSYTIHSIGIEEDHGRYFIFSAKYSVVPDDPDTDWKNEPHVEANGVLTFVEKFWVNKVGDTYYLRTVGF